ncbi:patatin-like phospholipase family protein [Zavarzinia sp.]|uniref:patatin-like phospholipase family protein n=1 Tax=Zavarzinia sp. TaxID=2027920 RepID=UPI0035621E1A
MRARLWPARKRRPAPEAAPVDAVASLVQQRKAAGSRPGQRDDGCRLALVIEGGGMRGVVGGGMVAALEARGLVDCFDAVYGTSAGSCAAAYLLAGQALYGTRIFYENINNPTFLRLGRALIRRPVMNIDYLIDQVMTRIRPLDTARILASPISLTMMATDVADGSAVALTGFSSGEEILTGLRASTRLPLVGGPPVAGPGGRRLVDGALSMPIAYALAAAEGATHILVLATRAEKPGIDGGPSRPTVARLLARHISPAIAEAYMNRPARYYDMVAKLAGPRLPMGAEPHLAVVRPSRRLREVRKIERGRGRLLKGANAGWKAVLSWLGEAEPPPFPDLAVRRLRISPISRRR